MATRPERTGEQQDLALSTAPGTTGVEVERSKWHSIQYTGAVKQLCDLSQGEKLVAPCRASTASAKAANSDVAPLSGQSVRSSGCH